MIRLVKTCWACPEQYDAFLGVERVGYLRMRHGVFRVDVPECGGRTIYEALPYGDGAFDEDERDYFLRFAVDAIEKWLAAGRPAEVVTPPPPDVKYELVE